MANARIPTGPDLGVKGKGRGHLAGWWQVVHDNMVAAAPFVPAGITQTGEGV